MTYLGYIIAAYAVFLIVLLWDMLTPYWQIRRLLQQVRLRQRRQQAVAARQKTPSTPVSS